MKLTKTNKFRVKINIPNFDKENVVIDSPTIGYNNYPEAFQQLYKFENYKEYFGLGDAIYRVATKGYEEIVKSVTLTEIHLNGDIELFPTKELAEQFLAEKEVKRTDKYSHQSVYQALETIQLFSKSNIKEETIQEIERKLKEINKQASNALKTLKNG